MAAGSWTSTSGIGDALVSVGYRTIEIALSSSKNNRAVIGHPVFQDALARDAAFGQLVGALGIGVSLANFGQGSMAAVSEGTAATPTDFSTTNVDISAARHAFARQVSDLAAELQADLLRGEIGPDAIAALATDAFLVWANTYVESVLSLASSATYEAGTTGTALTWDVVHDAVIDMQARGASGNAIGLIDATGAKQLSSDALAKGGAVQFDPSLRPAGPNLEAGAYIGSHFGVDWYIVPNIATSGTDKLGLILAPGAIASKHERVRYLPNADVILDGQFLGIEALRPGGSISTFEYTSYFGVSARDQAAMTALRYA